MIFISSIQVWFVHIIRLINVDKKEEKAKVLISNHPLCNYYKRKKYACNKYQAKLHVTS